MGFLTAVKETVVGDDREVGEETTNEGERPVAAESAGENQPTAQRASEIDFAVATGCTPKETILELVEAHEGRVEKAELVDLTGWSESTVDQKLGELERDGAIDRVRVGRHEVALLPGEPLVGEHTVSYDAHR